ncbi:MAG TPA: hypothetical protein VK338_01305 [Candidatus Nitrosocosmicus sp.]|nr:hypothetical protein [Candidatus Nitrosocosmicus sp.]
MIETSVNQSDWLDTDDGMYTYFISEDEVIVMPGDKLEAPQKIQRNEPSYIVIKMIQNNV